MDSGDELEQFCLLAKTSTGRACVQLIQQALNSKAVFVVGELLSMPNVQAVSLHRQPQHPPVFAHSPAPSHTHVRFTLRQLDQSDEHRPVFRLLELFAFGTYSDYKGAFYLFPCVCGKDI